MYSLTTVPASYSEIPFTSGKRTNFSFIVLGSLCEFCPQIDISVKIGVLRNIIRKKNWKKTLKILLVQIP